MIVIMNILANLASSTIIMLQLLLIITVILHKVSVLLIKE